MYFHGFVPIPGTPKSGGLADLFLLISPLDGSSESDCKYREFGMKKKIHIKKVILGSCFINKVYNDYITNDLSPS